MSIMRKRYVVVALALSLGGCQSAGPAGRAEPDQGAWRVLERVGEAHLQAPAAGDRGAIMARDEIPAASTVVTGTGGRLILARPDRQLVVGPKSRLRLSGAAGEGDLEQTEGRVRYRLAALPAAFAVTTPALSVRAKDAVLEIAVDAAGTEVTVETGEARVASSDGRFLAVVAAGGAARAGGPDDAGLMVRNAPARDYERIAPVLASRPQPAPEPAAEPARAAADDGGPGPAVVPAGFQLAPERPVRPSRPVPAARKDDLALADRAGASDERRPAPPADAEGTGGPAADVPGDRYIGLTEGLLGSLSAAGRR